MSRRDSVLWPVLTAFLLLTAAYLLLNPAATLRAAPQTTVWQVDRQEDPALFIIPAVAGLKAENDGPTTVNNPILLSATITDGEEVSYAWSFGDGSSSSGITTTHTYTQSGIYTATVVASDSINSLTATTTVYVGDAIVELGTATFNPNEVTIPVDGTVVWVRNLGTHSVTADDESFEQPLSANWSVFARSFDTAATIGYHCELHGAPGAGMAGTVLVGDGGQDDGEQDDQIHLLLPSIIRDGGE